MKSTRTEQQNVEPEQHHMRSIAQCAKVQAAVKAVRIQKQRQKQGADLNERIEVLQIASRHGAAWPVSPTRASTVHHRGHFPPTVLPF